MSELLPFSGQVMANQVAKSASPFKPITSAVIPFRVTPAIIGNVLQPFPCPHCGVVRTEVLDPKSKIQYTSGSTVTCPTCGSKYAINTAGHSSHPTNPVIERL